MRISDQPQHVQLVDNIITLVEDYKSLQSQINALKSKIELDTKSYKQQLLYWMEKSEHHLDQVSMISFDAAIDNASPEKRLEMFKYLSRAIHDVRKMQGASENELKMIRVTDNAAYKLMKHNGPGKED